MQEQPKQQSIYAWEYKAHVEQVEKELIFKAEELMRITGNKGFHYVGEGLCVIIKVPT